MNHYAILNQTQCQRVSDGTIMPLLSGCQSANLQLLLVWPQLGDFDSMEYAWWLQREGKQFLDQGMVIRAVGIGNRSSGEKFCDYTGFPKDWLFTSPNAQLHQQLDLYPGLSLKIPGFSKTLNTYLNLLLMCADIGSPGTLAEVLRGYFGDRQAPQLLDDEEVVRTMALPPIKGSLFQLAGGKGFQRPFELATLRLRNMTEVLRNWNTYVPNAAYLTQRGGTFLFNSEGKLLYQYRDLGLLGFAKDMSRPLSFLSDRL